MKPMSYTSYNRFVTCPKSYQLHYIDKLRPVEEPSHFIFGRAVDVGINAMLLDNESPLAACERELRNLVVENITFKSRDYDGELIDPTTKTELLNQIKLLGYTGDDVDGLVASLFEKDALSDNQCKVLALACTASMKALAALMLDAYKKHVLPEITKVYAVQRRETIKDANGKDIEVNLDVDCELRGHGRVVLDNKTASRPYADDSVETSTQLALYSQLPGFQKAAYAVLPKTPDKKRHKICAACGNNGTGGRHKTCNAEPAGVRCNGDWIESIHPEIIPQLIIAEIPQRMKDITLEAVSETRIAIDAGAFPRNLNACDFQYGQPCPYRAFCRHGSTDGLKKGET